MFRKIKYTIQDAIINFNFTNNLLYYLPCEMLDNKHKEGWKMEVSKTEVFISQNLSEQVYDIILQRIISGKYKTGGRINPNQLVLELNISRSPIKDALNKLYGAGIIDISPRKGHYVRKFLKKEVIDLFEFRLMLEVEAAKKSIRFLSNEDYELLKKNVEQSIKIAEENSSSIEVKIFELDRDFHRMIISRTKNKLFSKMANNIHILSHAVRIQFGEDRKRTLASQKEHQEILKALIKKDLKEIEYTITKHLENAKEFLLEFFNHSDTNG